MAQRLTRAKCSIRDSGVPFAQTSDAERSVRLAGVLSEDDLAPQARDELLEVFRDWKSR